MNMISPGKIINSINWTHPVFSYLCLLPGRQPFPDEGTGAIRALAISHPEWKPTSGCRAITPARSVWLAELISGSCGTLVIRSYIFEKKNPWRIQPSGIPFLNDNLLYWSHCLDGRCSIVNARYNNISSGLDVMSTSKVNLCFTNQAENLIGKRHSALISTHASPTVTIAI